MSASAWRMIARSSGASRLAICTRLASTACNSSRSICASAALPKAVTTVGGIIIASFSSLPFDGAGGKAGDNIALHNQVEEHRQNREDQPGGHVLLDRCKPSGLQGSQAHRCRLKLSAGKHDHRKQKLIPCREE